MKISNNNKEKTIKIFIYVLIFCVFMGSNFLKFNFYGINFNIARVLMIVASIVIFIYICMQIAKKNKNILNINKKLVKYCVIFFCLWSAYSIITIYKAKNLIDYCIMNFFLCIGTINILFFIKYLKTTEQNIIFNMINIPVFLNCIYYFFLYFIKKENIGGLYYNSNDLATVLLLTIPISIYLILSTKNVKLRVLNSVFLLTYIVSFFVIMSRACVLGIIFAIFIFCILLIFRNRKKILKNNFLRRFIIVTFCVVVISGVYIYIHYVEKISFAPVEDAKISNEVRTNLIFNGLHFLTQDTNFLFGIGAGNNEYYLKNYSIYSINNIYNFHNFWLDILVEYGIFIFIGFICVYGILCKKLYNKIDDKVSKIYLFFLMSFIIASISSSSIITREWLWIIFAIIISYINNYQIDNEERVNKK